MVRQRVRIRFAKQGDLRLISHRDLMRTWERLFRRAGVVLAMTEGFHPKPKMMFPSALAVGIEGQEEVLEIELADRHDGEELARALREQAPSGLEIRQLELLGEGSPKARVQSVTFAVGVPEELVDDVQRRLTWLMAQSSYTVSREGRKSPLDLRPLIESLSLDGDRLRMRLRVDGDGSARPREVLAALGLADVESHGLVLAREQVELAS